MNYPMYTMRRLDDHNNWALTIEKNIQLMLPHGNLTSIVWHVTQEFHCHDFWEISLVLRGSSTQRFLDKTEPMQPGSVYIMRPHDVHCITPDKPEMPKDMQSAPYVHRDIYIPIEKMKRICGALDENLYETLLARKYPLSASLSVSETNSFESTLNYFAGLDEDFAMMYSVIVSHILCTVMENQQAQMQLFGFAPLRLRDPHFANSPALAICRRKRLYSHVQTNLRHNPGTVAKTVIQKFIVKMFPNEQPQTPPYVPLFPLDVTVGDWRVCLA